MYSVDVSTRVPEGTTAEQRARIAEEMRRECCEVLERHGILLESEVEVFYADRRLSPEEVDAVFDGDLSPLEGEGEDDGR